MSCQKDADVLSNVINAYEIDKNCFILNCNGDFREYYVHGPVSYNENDAIPVVFMLHGTSSNGEKFYNISGWKELGEKRTYSRYFYRHGNIVSNFLMAQEESLPSGIFLLMILSTVQVKIKEIIVILNIVNLINMDIWQSMKWRRILKKLMK